MAWRSLLRNKVSSIVNMGGLMVGLAAGIVILLWIMKVLGYDRFNTNLKDIHQVMINWNLKGNIRTGSGTPGPLGPVLRNEMPDLKYVVRTQEGGPLVRYGNKSLYQRAIYTEPDYFPMMSFPAIEGDPVVALKGNKTVVLTQRTAQRLFGKGEAMGKTIILDNAYTLKVGAVIWDVPENSTMQFDMVLPFVLFEQGNASVYRWDYTTVNTWIQLQPGVHVADVNRKLTQIFLDRQSYKDAAWSRGRCSPWPAGQPQS